MTWSSPNRPGDQESSSSNFSAPRGAGPGLRSRSRHRRSRCGCAARGAPAQRRGPAPRDGRPCAPAPHGTPRENRSRPPGSASCAPSPACGHRSRERPLRRLVLTDRLSMITTAGSGIRPFAARAARGSDRCSRVHTPSGRQRRKYHHTAPQGGESEGIRRHWQPVRSRCRIASITTARSVRRGRPGALGAARCGAITAHCASVRSVESPRRIMSRLLGLRPNMEPLTRRTTSHTASKPDQGGALRAPFPPIISQAHPMPAFFVGAATIDAAVSAGLAREGPLDLRAATERSWRCTSRASRPCGTDDPLSPRQPPPRRRSRHQSSRTPPTPPGLAPRRRARAARRAVRRRPPRG